MLKSWSIVYFEEHKSTQKSEYLFYTPSRINFLKNEYVQLKLISFILQLISFIFTETSLGYIITTKFKK